MNRFKKLNTAREILLSELLPKIKDERIDDERPVLKITFFKGYILYIRYNDYGEYSYHFVYSQKPLDRIRYDNYDDTWNVDTTPHHFHPRAKKPGISSPMNGTPAHDMPILLKKLLNELL